MKHSFLIKMGFLMSCPAVVLLVYLVLVPNGSKASQRLRELKNYHTHKDLSDSEIHQLASQSDPQHWNTILDNILIPRVVGTPNHRKVGLYIENELKNLGFTVELDEFNSETPNFGNLKFKNIVGTLNPNAERFLVLACHYDSKYFKQEEFVGAIDSAVPCAMMLNLAKTLQTELLSTTSNNFLSLKLIFFDGEEAFVEWTATDSIYGARHLAEKYESSLSSIRSTNEVVTELDKIDVLVLLDLIGHRGTFFSSHFRNTDRWFGRLVTTEKRLRKLGLLKNRGRYFSERASTSHIEDDHIPFVRRAVPALHLISTPFPKEWHTVRDDRNIIDANTVEDLNKIFRVFLAEYLHFNMSALVFN